MGPFGIHLALAPGRPPIRCPDIIGGIGGDIDAPDGTPIEDTPDWEPGDGNPGDVVVVGGDIALGRLLENGVLYKNPNAGPGNKRVSATLIEVSLDQGEVAPLAIDGQNFAAVGYFPSEGKVKAKKVVDGTPTALGEALLSPLSGATEIGAVARGNQMWMTVDGEIAGGPYAVNEVAAATQSGLIAEGPVSATAWIGGYQSRPISIGFGRGYGMAFGGS